MNRFYHHIFAMSAGVALALLAGCVSDNSLCPSPEEGIDSADPTMAMRFTVITRNADDAASRADDCYEDQTGSAAENFINLADCQFLLFDENEVLLRPIFPQVSSTDNVNYTWYSLTAEITEKYFTQKVKAGTDVTFYIMVIANSGSLEGQSFALSPGKTTIQSIGSQRRTFRQPEGYANASTGWNYTAWSPSVSMADNRFIPMAGVQKFTVPASALAGSTFETPVDLSGSYTSGIQISNQKDINMLRALSKIEIIDHLNIDGVYDPAIDESNSRPRVEKVTLYGVNMYGTLMPAIGTGQAWPNPISGQVTMSTIPANPGYQFPVVREESVTENGATFLSPILNDNSIVFSYDAYATNRREDKCRVFSGYIVEFDRALVPIAQYPDNFKKYHDGYPTIQVNLYNPEQVGQNESPNYWVRVAKYTDGKAGDGLDALLRNHIYRYQINNMKSDMSGVVWTVCDMMTGQTEIVFN